MLSRPLSSLAILSVSICTTCGNAPIPTALSNLTVQVTSAAARAPRFSVSFPASTAGDLFRTSLPIPGRWASPPALMVERATLVLTDVADSAFQATARQMSEGEATALAQDLSSALPDCTGDPSMSFAQIFIVLASEGSEIPMAQPGIITLARFQGLRQLTGQTLVAQWSFDDDGVAVAGSIFLDADSDPGFRTVRAGRAGAGK